MLGERDLDRDDVKQKKWRRFEHLEHRHLLAADFVISEFLSSNQNGLLDEDGDSSDWIELTNTGDEAGSLDRFSLTDDADDLAQWRLPDITLAAGDTLLVYASGKNRANANSELHANFRLSVNGEFLALVEPDGTTIASAYSPEYPSQVADVSYGTTADGLTRGFFTTPTPGGRNPAIATSDPTRQIVINELMYHPSSENSAEEYIELYNIGTNEVDLSQWVFDDGVDFAFPSVSLPGGGYLVVASDLEAFQTKYPTVTNVIGGWDGKLSNAGERVSLKDALGQTIDRVTYADEGDWAQRALDEPDRGTRGWIWLDDHDGGGKSLELINALLPNDYGQNWSASQPEQGTPGAANSVASDEVAPIISDVMHSPAIPSSSDHVVVTSRSLDATLDNTAYLYWRVADDPFQRVEMQDNGQSGDLTAGDGLASAQIPPHPDGTVVEFYILAEDASGNTRTWPAETANAGQSANLLYQVHDQFDASNWVPGSAPIYFEIMTDAERETFRQIVRESDAQMNATLISATGTGIDVRYNTGVRIRGSGSRRDNPPNNRINIPSDRPLQGVTALNINSRRTHNQVAGSALFRLAGLPAAEAKNVVLQSNGRDLFEGNQFYAHVEPLNSEFVANQFPEDPDGNLYKGRRPNESPPGSLGAGLVYFGEDPVAYGGYTKQTNESEADWSDVIRLTDVLNNTPDAEYIVEVEKVIDLDQWLRFFAMSMLMDYSENGLIIGDPLGDDYAMYRGTVDTRFKMVVHDLDTLFVEHRDGIFPMTRVPALNRLMYHHAVLPRYYAQLRDVSLNIANSPEVELTLRQALQNISSPEEIDETLQFLSDRASFILAQIPSHTMSVESPLPIVGEFHRSTSDQITLSGLVDSSTASILVNGEIATINGRERTWSIGSGQSGPAESLVPRGATWSYLDDGSNQETAWREVDFPDAASWATGEAEFGYGDNDEKTEISFGPDSQNKFITTYFRHEFTASNVDEIAALNLGLLRDDGAAVYLNGVEVARDNLDPNAEYDTRSNRAVTGNEEEQFFDFSIDPSLLSEGQNLLAVEVHQGLRRSNDLSFDLELEAFRRGDVDGLQLNPGVNRISVQAFSRPNGEGQQVASSTIDIWYDDGNTEDVSGPLPATPVVWTAAQGPYRVSGTVVVPPDGQLTIEPGTTVYFDEAAKLEVRGILIAEGNEFDRIRFTSVPNSPLVPNEPDGANGLPDAPPHWDGIQFVGSMHSENLISHADVEYAQSLDGAIGARNSELIVDNATFRGTYLRMVKSHSSSVIVQNSVFPDMFAEDEIPAQLGLDNVSEQVNMTGSIPADGHLIIRNNVFGTNKGHNDVIDAVSGRRPDPILQVLDNVFLGSGDEELDLGGDVYVAGNVFTNVFKDDETSDRGYANAISTGDNGANTTTVVARNVFWDVDHAINLKRHSATIFENNTVVDIHPDFNDRFDHPNVGSAINLYVDEPGAVAGSGAYAAGNIFANTPRVFGNADLGGTTTALQLNNNLLTTELASTTVGDREGTILDLGVGNTVADPRFVDSTTGDFRLGPGSAGLPNGAFGVGWLGIELGAGASRDIAITGQPVGTTGTTEALLTVGGPGLFGYRFRHNGGPWSVDLPIGAGAEAGFIANNTVRTAEIRFDNLEAGTHTVEVLGQDFAGEWQAVPTSVRWDVEPEAKIEISEILASNTTQLTNAGSSPDYVELRNVGGRAIDLRGYGLSDREGDPYRFAFPSETVVLPGGYLVIDSDVLGFGLSKEGDAVFLTAPVSSGGTLQDSIKFGAQVNDLSISRHPFDGNWSLSVPTLGSKNEAQPTGDPSSLKINEWLASDDTFDDFIELYNPDELPVSLEGLFLTDELAGAPTMHAIEPLSFVAGQGFVVMSAGQPESLSFGLSADQEVLGLLDSSQQVIDVVVYFPQTTGYSQGRKPAGADEFQFFGEPTPGRANGVTLLGDFNSDGSYSIEDLDLLYAAISDQNPNQVAEFDLTEDGQVNADDIDFWVTELAGRRPGDINLDGQVDFGDFLVLSSNFGRNDASWGTGDFDGDREVTLTDFLLLSLNFGEE